MRVELPRYQVPMLQGDLMSRDWLRAFRDLWNSLGYNQDVAVYGDLSAPLLFSSGAVSFAVIGTSDVQGFPTGADEDASMQVRIPNDYRDGSDITPYFVWVASSINAGNVAWNFSHSAGPDDSVLPAVTTQSTVTAAPEARAKPTRVNLTAIDGSGIVRGDTLAINLEREGTLGTDTYSGSAGVLLIGLKYVRDGIGAVEAHP